MTRRVLHVIARMNVGGTASYLYNLITNSSNQIEHLLVMGNVVSPEIEDSRVNRVPNVRVRHLARQINVFRDISAQRDIRDIIKTFKPDVINSHTFKAGLLTRTLLGASVPHIHTFHGHLLDDPEFAGVKKIAIVQVERLLAHRSTILTTTGDNVRKDLHRAGIRHPYWRNIYPGLDPLAEISKENSIANLGLQNFNPERLTIAWHSRFAPVKNVELVMKIAELLPECNFLMSGGGPLYEQYQSAHPVNVTLLGWQSPEHVFGASDILISTSFNEGLSFSLIEASMLGKPAIATNVGAAEEIIEDCISGYIVPNSAEAFVERIIQLMKEPELRVKMGATARSLALARFGMNLFVERYLDLIEETIQRADNGKKRS